MAYETVTVQNKLFRSLKSACTFYGMHSQSVRYRLSKGWSLEEALELKPLTKQLDNKCEGVIYIIKNTVNKKVYIGVTTNSLSSRFSAHKHAAKSNKTKLHKALNTIGADKFYVECLVKTKSRSKLRHLETKFINEYNSIKKGYNTTKGGCRLNYNFSKPLVYNGVTYDSITSLARYLGIDRKTVVRRIEKGSLLSAPSDFQYKKVKYRNKTYRCLRDLSIEINIPITTLRKRLNKGLCLNGSSANTGKKGYYKGAYIQ